MALFNCLNMGFLERSVSTREPHATTYNSVNEKRHLLFVLVLLKLAPWVLRGLKRIDVTVCRT